MGKYNIFLVDFDKFKTNYLEELQKSNNLLKDTYVSALDAMGLKSSKCGFVEIEDILLKVNSLSTLGLKIKEIQKLSISFQKEFIRSSQNFNSDSNKEKAIDDVLCSLNDILTLLRDTDKKIIEEVNLRKSNIAICEYGQQENRTKNALEFERNVIELLSWLFVDEMRLLTKYDITQEQLQRDGVFEVSNDFDFINRELDKIKFSHIVVECKNYRKPSYDDLMQVYAYTLMNKIYPLAHNPLCLLISRENPSKDSITIKIRDKLFEKKGGNFLLVLFLACEDLNKMCELREQSGDPFLVLKENIKKILRDNVTKES